MSATQEDAIRNFCQQKGITEEELGRKISEGIQKYMPPFPIDTYKKGYQDAIGKACEWIERFAYNSVITDNIGEREKQAIIIAFKEAMEE